MVTTAIVNTYKPAQEMAIVMVTVMPEVSQHAMTMDTVTVTKV
jgi:hypothetical protein